MKLVFVCHGIGNGGAERVLTVLSNRISELGHSVTIITTNPSNNDYTINSQIEHVKAYRDCGRIKRFWKRIQIIRTTINRIKPDCIVSFSATCNVQVLLSVLFLNCKVIISERTDPSRYPDSMVYKVLRKLLYPLSNKIVFQTQMARDYFKGIIWEKGCIIANPVRNNLPDPCFKRESKKLIGVGALCEQKNWMMALKASKMFFAKHPDYIFEIYGEGADRESLNRVIVNDECLRNRVFLRGFCNNIEEKLNEATIYISTSDYEGISNSMLEALAMGVPTVCTDCPVGGARAMIMNGENGFLVPVKAYKTLAKYLDKMANSKILREHLSKEAVKIRDKYSEDKIVQEWLNLIKRIVGGKQ